MASERARPRIVVHGWQRELDTGPKSMGHGWTLCGNGLNASLASMKRGHPSNGWPHCADRHEVEYFRRGAGRGWHRFTCPFSPPLEAWADSDSRLLAADE